MYSIGYLSNHPTRFQFPIAIIGSISRILGYSSTYFHSFESLSPFQSVPSTPEKRASYETRMIASWSLREGIQCTRVALYRVYVLISSPSWMPASWQQPLPEPFSSNIVATSQDLPVTQALSLVLIFWSYTLDQNFDDIFVENRSNFDWKFKIPPVLKYRDRAQLDGCMIVCLILFRLQVQHDFLFCPFQISNTTWFFVLLLSDYEHNMIVCFNPLR